MALSGVDDRRGNFSRPAAEEHHGRIYPTIVENMRDSRVQGVLARGVLQNSLRRVLNDGQGVVSVIIASLVFGLFHSHFGLGAIAVTMASGLIFGWLFIRHGNLIGATIVHVLAGVAAFALKMV